MQPAVIHDAYLEKLVATVRPPLGESFEPLLPPVPRPMAGPRPYHIWFKIIDEIEVQRPGYPPVRYIQDAVCRHFKITHSEMISGRREARILRPRSVAIFLSKTLTLQTLPRIGKLFGGRDHSTILHSIRRVEALRTSDDVIDLAVTTLTSSTKAAWGMQ